MPEARTMTLDELVERDALAGGIVTPKLLARRYGGTALQARGVLDRLVRQGRLVRRTKLPRNGRKSLPQTIYFPPRETPRLGDA